MAVNNSSKIRKIKYELYSNEELLKNLIRAKEYVDENYSKKISVETIARVAKIKKYKFIILFRTYYGKTPLKYLNAVRLIYSKSLLKSNEMTIAEVSKAVGFTSVSSYSELFKLDTGLTPMVFRKNETVQKNRLNLSSELAQLKKKRKRT